MSLILHLALVCTRSNSVKRGTAARGAGQTSTVQQFHAPFPKLSKIATRKGSVEIGHFLVPPQRPPPDWLLSGCCSLDAGPGPPRYAFSGRAGMDQPPTDSTRQDTRATRASPLDGHSHASRPLPRRWASLVVLPCAGRQPGIEQVPKSCTWLATREYSLHHPQH